MWSEIWAEIWGEVWATAESEPDPEPEPEPDAETDMPMIIPRAEIRITSTDLTDDSLTRTYVTRPCLHGTAVYVRAYRDDDGYWVCRLTHIEPNPQ